MSRALRKVKIKRHGQSLKEILSDEGKKVRLFLLILGILLVVWGWSANRVTPAPVTNSTVNVPNVNRAADIVSFSQEPVTVDKGLLTLPKNKNSNPPVRIAIGSVNIDLPVKEAKVVKGYWEVFPDSAGFGLGSAYPEENGNTVIFAHARPGQFAPLKIIKTGAEILVYTKEKYFSYKVDSIREVLPSQTEVIAPSKDPILTLYTCSGFSDSKRLIVVAKRV